MNYIARALFLIALTSISIPVSALGIEQVLANQTKTERALSELAADLASLPRDSASIGASDAEAERIWSKGKALWDRSPANSRSTYSMAGSGAYEINILLQALVKHYTLTGRTGRAIPLLEACAEESRSLRYYDFWRRLSLQLAEYYLHVGMVDHAAARIDVLLKFMSRLRLDLDHLPGTIDFDTVALIQMHALMMELRPDSYARDEVDALYNVFRKSIDEGAEHWGWTSRDGFRYVAPMEAFLLWYAKHSDPETLERVVEDFKGIVAGNVAIDPLRLADELDVNFMMAQLGRDLFGEINIRTSNLLTSDKGLFESADPQYLRYREVSPFTSSLALAKAYVRAGVFETAMSHLISTESLLPGIDEMYRKIPSEYRALDQFSLMEMEIVKIRALVHEGLGEDHKALVAFDEYIRWSEKERESIPLGQRQHFFRGQARDAYLGAIRSAAHLYTSSTADENLEILIGRAERLRARQFLEALGRDTTPTSVTLDALRVRVGDQAGILILQDLESEVLTLFIGSEGARIALFEKSDEWDAGVFRTRNRLAEEAHYDKQAFNQIGIELLGSIGDEIEKTTRLYVLTDGVMSALPPSIIPYFPDRKLADGRAITVLPSLSLWLGDHRQDGTIRQESILVLADPAFQQAQRIVRIGKELMSSRGSTALGYFAPLPETREEGSSVLSRFSRGKMLAGKEALESKVKAEPLSTYTHLHFATHGVISNDLPGITEPALVLGYEDSEDGLLFASEVSELELDAELTVLSACNTGNGEYFSGEGLMGMGRAFMLAGSRNVIVSLWPVESYSTQRMMEYLYEFLARGMSIDVALWNAQRRLRGERVATIGDQRGLIIEGDDTPTPATTDYANPYYWSPFLLITTESSQ